MSEYQTAIDPGLPDKAAEKDIISWGETFSTGIESIDKQHRHLVALTNQLYKACMVGGDSSNKAFKESMKRVVEYVRFHFHTEQEILEKINYPDILKHKKEHEALIMQILDFSTNKAGAKRFVPNNFVRFLKDWIVSHIAHSDKMYGRYIEAQKKKGLLSEIDIK